MTHINAWLVVALCSIAAGVAACVWQRIVAARKYERLDKKREEAERGKSNADVELKARCDEIKRLREDAADDLKRQGDQFRDEIHALNAKLDTAQGKIREALEKGLLFLCSGRFDQCEDVPSVSFAVGGDDTA